MSKTNDTEIKDIIVRNSKTNSGCMFVFMAVLAIFLGYLVWIKGDNATGNKIGFFVTIAGMIFYTWIFFDKTPIFIIRGNGIECNNQFYCWRDIEEVKCKTEQFGGGAAHPYLIITFTNDYLVRNKMKKRHKVKKWTIHGADYSFGQIQFYSTYYKAVYDKQNKL
jgi:hypothetical protein